MRKILYATDGSEGAIKAGHLVKTLLTGYPDANVDVLYVTQEILYPYAVAVPDTTPHENEVAQQIRTVVTDDLLAGEISRVHFHHIFGRPAGAVSQYAAETGSDLIVVGSHGKGAVDRMLLGSVSHETALRSHVPVLVVPESANPELLKRIDRIVFATDGSPSTSLAVDLTCDLLDRFPQATLTGVYAMEEIFPSRFDRVAEHVRMEETEKAESLENHLREDIFHHYTDRFHFRTDEGNAAEVVCDIAESEKANLLVLGSHDSTRVGRFFLGSVAQTIVHRSKVPVLIAKSPRG